MNQALVQDVVAEVMRRLSAPPRPHHRRLCPRRRGRPRQRALLPPPPHSTSEPVGQYGVFASVDEAVTAATEAQTKLAKLSLDDRDAIVKLIKSMAKQNAQGWGQMEFDETKIGRLDHKVEKLQILELVPGVEFLRTNAISGTNGVCLEEYAPFGVIGIITPVTHSVPTLGANAVNMIASGNSIVANPHPSGTRCAVHAVREWNKAINARYGIEHLITIISKPTLETAEQLFHHRGISLLVVTGGPAVARAALKASKRAIVAGPGNPPVVVDETACLDNAAVSIIKGAAYDNNLLCIGEKQVFAVESIASSLIQTMQQNGAYLLNAQQIEALTKVAFKIDDKGHPHVNKDLVGRDAAVLGQAIGLRVPPTVQVLIGETNFDHPFVQEEQMMPFAPLVRVKNVEEAMDLAIKSEHGYRHTAIIHSRNMDTVTKFGRRANTTLLVVNGASPAGLGLGGQGHLSYSIATPTGEGITTPLTFTRYRRIMMTGALRMI